MRSSKRVKLSACSPVMQSYHVIMSFTVRLLFSYLMLSSNQLLAVVLIFLSNTWQERYNIHLFLNMELVLLSQCFHLDPDYKKIFTTMFVFSISQEQQIPGEKTWHRDSSTTSSDTVSHSRQEYFGSLNGSYDATLPSKIPPLVLTKPHIFQSFIPHYHKNWIQNLTRSAIWQSSKI